MRRVIALTALAALAAGASIAASSVSSAAVKPAAVKPVNVQVYAFPSPKAYPHVSGAKVPMIPVASTATTGRTFSVSLSGLPKGTTNLVAIGLSGGSIVDESFFSASRAGKYTGVFPDIAHVSTTVVDRALAHPNAPNVLVCTTYFARALGNLPAIVGGVFSTISGGGTESFSYEEGASSAVGVGTSASGKAGSFSAGGTYTVTNDVENDGGPYPLGASHEFKVLFTEGEYDTRCIQTLTGSETITYFTKTEGVYGGWTPVTVKSITAKQCASYTGPYTLTRTSTKAWEFKSGLGIPAIDFTASTDTGYTTTAKVSYHLNSGVTRKICGVSSGPSGANPQLLQVEP
jgi:hypothetical protein